MNRINRNEFLMFQISILSFIRSIDYYYVYAQCLTYQKNKLLQSTLLIEIVEIHRNKKLMGISLTFIS